VLPKHVGKCSSALYMRLDFAAFWPAGKSTVHAPFLARVSISYDHAFLHLSAKANSSLPERLVDLDIQQLCHLINLSPYVCVSVWFHVHYIVQN
jgi:hypothetical protein